ncbi:hypothetical protein [Micromonospora schwarzwaldensis]|uniref:hypothetical protein n=1 Tax=Micromonospora sp. DSM 45708 TaxID=3111767 RepID=UPI0031D70E40
MSEANTQGSASELVEWLLGGRVGRLRRRGRRQDVIGFHLVADFGDLPDLREVGDYLRNLDVLWSYCLELAILDTKDKDGERARELLADAERFRLGDRMLVDEAVPSLGSPDEGEIALGPDEAYHLFMRQRGARIQVRRLTMASPLDVLLEASLGEVKWAGYVAGGLVALERLCQLVMNWQTHRLDLAERRAALTTHQGPERVGTEIASQLSPHGIRVMPQVQDGWNTSDPVSTLADRRLIQGRAIPPDSNR